MSNNTTNKDKLKTPEQPDGVNVFTYETSPNGNQVRWTRTSGVRKGGGKAPRKTVPSKPK
jgi:hypothetical protein